LTTLEKLALQDCSIVRTACVLRALDEDGYPNGIQRPLGDGAEAPYFYECQPTWSGFLGAITIFFFNLRHFRLDPDTHSCVFRGHSNVENDSLGLKDDALTMHPVQYLYYDYCAVGCWSLIKLSEQDDDEYMESMYIMDYISSLVALPSQMQSVAAQ